MKQGQVTVTNSHEVPLIVDGAQALGLIDINVNDPPMDFLATTASKWLMGPTGVRFLYLKDRYLSYAPPSVGWLAAANVADWDVRHCRLHDDAMRFQGGIPNLVGVVGALAGLNFLKQVGREFIERRVRKLTAYLLEKLETIGVDIWTPRADNERAGIVFSAPPTMNYSTPSSSRHASIAAVSSAASVSIRPSITPMKSWTGLCHL